ncbi:hypothetical protein OS493_031656 [Desmophyllum pertusum]|uniref:NACHT domain-containing protein n=1 Tax=Desmophyllum pertusum TaxID=174260 RepID=A0A9X0D6N4_9CNID|nr:hypothetical protein OS493_031656 [Desmophyllum pertusum]
MGHAVDQNLLSLVQQDVKELIDKYTKTEMEQSAIQESLDQQRTEQIEMQNTVASLQDQQSSTRVHLKEHDEQLEAVMELMKENKGILETLVSVEKTLSEELMNRVQDVEKGLGETDDRVKQLKKDVSETGNKMEQLEQGFAKTDDKVEQLEKDFSETGGKIEQLEQGFAKTDDKVEQLEQGFAKTDDKVEQLEKDVSEMGGRMEQLEHGFAKTDDKVEQLEKDVSETGGKVKQLEQEVRSQRMKENKPEASPVETFDLKTCQSKLAEHYQKTAKVPTTVWSSVCQLELDQIYTRLSWVKEEQTPAGSSQKELGHYTEMFTEKTKNGFVPKRILVRGQTGIGKTTFVKKLLVDWSNLDDAKMEVEQKDALRKFELVVAVTLKEVSKCQTLREVINHSRLFPKDEEFSTDDLLCYIRKNQDKVLFVFDGYDEYRTGSDAEIQYGSRSNSPIYEIFHGEILRDCTVLVTTRSSTADEVGGSADMQAEITGFDVADRKAFMRKMLDGETEVDDLLQFLSRNDMEDLARVPLLTLFFCLLWREEKEKLIEIVKSKAKLYRAIVKHILQYSHRKHSPTQACKVKEENYEDILAEIGKVALTGLLKGDLVFEYGQLPEKVRGEKSLIVGLFQLSEYGPSLEPMEMVSFIHKSIQEFLAAWYITYRCVPEGNVGGIEEHVRTLKDCEAFENVFQFICGLSDDGAVKVLEHLTSVRISDPTLDLSKIIPDVENETDVPLYDVTGKHYSFSDLVYRSFQEVHSKSELLTHCFNCTGGIVLVTEQLTELLQKAKVKDLTQVTHSDNVQYIEIEQTFETVYELLELLDCMHVPLRITKSSEVLTVGDFLRKLQNIGCQCDCFFNAILCFPNAGAEKLARLLPRFNNTIDLRLNLSDCCAAAVDTLVPSITHKTLRRLVLSGISLTPAVAAALGRSLPEMSSLQKLWLSGSDESNVQAEEMEVLFGGFYKTLPLLELTFSGFSVISCVAPLTKSLRFFPILRELYLEELNMDEHNLCHFLKSLRFIPNLEVLSVTGKPLSHAHCCTAEVNTATGFTHETLRSLVMSGISLTPAVAAALGRSLPKMSSLQKLWLTGLVESTVQAEEMEALFGGFNKTLPLYNLTFSGFSVISCLAPLTKSLRFFPNLRELYLAKLNMDERNLCHLLENLRFIPNLEELSVTGKPLSHAHCCTGEVNTAAGFTHKTLRRLVLNGISLTPAVAATLGRSLPEMSSLDTLQLTAADGSNVRAEVMEALFGGFNKTLPLDKLIFRCFSASGCLAPLTKSLRFFPNLGWLFLDKLNMDERDLCGLLESFQFIPKLWYLSLSGNPLGHAVTSIVPHVINLPKLDLLDIYQTGSEEDLNYVVETIKQAKPGVTIYL